MPICFKLFEKLCYRLMCETYCEVKWKSWFLIKNVKKKKYPKQYFIYDEQ